MMKLLEKINNGRLYTIAEMSANHAGLLENALEIVRAAKRAGADCLKIQTYTADTLTIDCDNEYFRIKGGLWDGRNLYDLYNEAYTPWEWHKAIKDECDSCGIDFLSTPFDKTAVDMLDDMGVEAFKIASFELVDIPLIEYAASKGKPLIISCGMGSVEEIQDAVDACRRCGNSDIVLLKCCSEYPAKLEDMRLANIADMRDRFGFAVGLSDHSLGNVAAMAAVALGARVIEKHFCLSRAIKNPDSEFSLEPEEFSRMIKECGDVISAVGKVGYKLTDSEKSSTVFRRSIFAVRDVSVGEVFTEDNVRVIRPGYGAKPKHLERILGTKADRQYGRGEPIVPEGCRSSVYSDRDADVLLRPATIADARMLFEWRNEPETRRNSFNSGELLYSDHLKWLEEKLSDSNSAIFICCRDGVPVGQIRCDMSEDGTGVISYSIDAENRGKGIGREMIKLAMEESRRRFAGLKTVAAYVKSANIASAKALLANGFVLAEREEIERESDKYIYRLG